MGKLSIALLFALTTTSAFAAKKHTADKRVPSGCDFHKAAEKHLLDTVAAVGDPNIIVHIGVGTAYPLGSKAGRLNFAEKVIVFYRFVDTKHPDAGEDVGALVVNNSTCVVEAESSDYLAPISAFSKP